MTPCGAEPSPRVRALLLALVVAAHGVGASAALHLRVPPDVIAPGVLQVRWIAGGGSPSPAPIAPASSGSVAPEPLSMPEPPPVVPEVPRVVPPPLTPRPVKRLRTPPPPRQTPSSRTAPESAPVVAPVASSAIMETAPSSGASAGDGGANISTGLSTGVSNVAASVGAGRGVGGGGNSDYVGPSHRAAYLSNPPPAYPPASRRREEEGSVALRVHITVDGRADEVLLHRSSGFERLDQAAMEAVRRWRFVPARRGRENVPGWVVVPIQFSMEN
jgi:protein TonB